jgi:hypothetical protein
MLKQDWFQTSFKIAGAVYELLNKIVKIVIFLKTVTIVQIVEIIKFVN